MYRVLLLLFVVFFSPELGFGLDYFIKENKIRLIQSWFISTQDSICALVIYEIVDVIQCAVNLSVKDAVIQHIHSISELRRVDSQAISRIHRFHTSGYNLLTLLFL